MSIPRSASRSSTLRSDSGYLTYIITTRRMTSGELLKYRNGLLMAQSLPRPEAPRAFGLTEPSWTPEPQHEPRGGPEFESAHSSRDRPRWGGALLFEDAAV